MLSVVKMKVFIFMLFYISYTLAQSVPTSDQRCAGEVRCTSCVDSGPTCAWCKQWGFSGPRCDLPEVLRAAGCPEEHVYLRGNSQVKLGQDNEFSDYGDDEESFAVQVRPQNARVTLRAGESKSINIPFKFRAAKNYPLDVYYLMDLTWSMKDDKETLASLGGDLAKALGNLTQNFRLGFGSYVDKPTMPFVDQAKLSNPCSVEFGTCEAAYGFRHHLSFDRNTSQFVNNVKSASVSGNLDNAEGGLDALLQAIVCKDDVGWSTESRKLVLLASDGILHFAGDGKLGGVVRNNDGKCHLDPETGLYTMSDKQDYPSLGQIDRLLLHNKVNVIFAVTEDRLKHYMYLSEVLSGSTFVAALEEDSSNIIQLVRKGYQDIVSSITFNDNATSPLRVVYQSSCGGNQRIATTNTCEDIKEGEEYDFTLQLYLDSCPVEPNLWQQRVSVEERGIVTGLNLDVELLCGCGCEFEAKSERCAGNGDFECGVCHCNDEWFGPTCNCTGRNATTVPELDVECLPAEAALQGIDVCYGQGDCICGQCVCHNNDAHGKFCECDDSRCDRWGAQGERCGGPGRGRCVCGSCECEPGWTGSSCSCPLDQSICIAPGDTKPCSGQGNCVCGQCICRAVEDYQARYTGRFCEKCDTCKGLCELYRPCVLCKAFDYGCPKQGEDLCHTNTSDSYLDIVTALHVLEDSEEQLCVFPAPEDGCQIKFSYRLGKDRVVRLRVLQSRTCVPPINTATIAGGIIIFVVLLGLCLLCIWRGVVAAKDKIEYQRFMEAQNKAMVEAGENPLYKPAVTYYTVPKGYTGPIEPASPSPSTPGSFPLSPK